MSAHRTTLVASVIVTVASACGAPPDPSSPRSTVVAVPVARLGALTPGERIEAALAHHDRARAARVELTAAPESAVPHATKSAALAQASPGKGVITMASDELASRMLSLPDLQLRRLESSDVARQLLRTCFAAATSPELVVSLLELEVSKTTIESADERKAPHAACVRKQIAEHIEANGRNVRLRISARFFPRSEGAAGDAPAPTAASIDEELAELGRKIPASSEPARTRDLVVLLGTRHVEAARLATEPKSRDQHLAAAKVAFDEALVRAGTDVPSRTAALHGLADTLAQLGKLDEAVRASRALVCPSRFPAATEPAALEQDHPERWWSQWENVHTTPIALTKPAQRKPVLVAPGSLGPRSWDEETKYRSPYDGCTPPADVPAAWVVDAWRDIASFHAEHDVQGGAFHDNRAATALRFALASATGDSAAFVALELGRVLIHQQRYAEALRVLGRLSPLSGDRELIERAAQLVATSLTYVDLEGPGESEPMVDRLDVLDMDPNPLVAEKKLQVVEGRADQPELVPQNATFTPPVLHWLAWELATLGMNHPAVAVQRKFLVRFPNHRDAPLVQWEQAETYATMALYYRTGAPEAAEPTRLAGEARARLAQYVGNTAWTEANRNDTEALRRAADLARAKPSTSP